MGLKKRFQKPVSQKHCDGASTSDDNFFADFPASGNASAVPSLFEQCEYAALAPPAIGRQHR
jgi:hypothetical protein